MGKARGGDCQRQVLTLPPLPGMSEEPGLCESQYLSVCPGMPWHMDEQRVCRLREERQRGMGRAVAWGVREAISQPQALTQQFCFFGSSSGLCGDGPRVSSRSVGTWLWDPLLQPCNLGPPVTPSQTGVTWWADSHVHLSAVPWGQDGAVAGSPVHLSPHPGRVFASVCMSCVCTFLGK